MKVTVRKAKETWRQQRWMVRYYHQGKPVRSFFASQEIAESHARDLRQTFKSGANPTDLAEALRLTAGTGYKIAELVKAGLDWVKSSAGTAANPLATFADGVDKFVANATRKGRRKKTLAGYKYAFNALKVTLGPKLGATLTEHEVEQYLNSLCGRTGVPGTAAPDTLRTVLGQIRSALRAIGIQKPLPNIVLPAAKESEVRFFSVEDVISIFKASRPEERGMIALTLFAAIRPETLQELPAECVNVADKSIRIPAALSKDGKAHLLEGDHRLPNGVIVHGLPDVLWKWLDQFPFNPARWSSIQKRLRDVPGGGWVHDGMRHTGATYYRALYGREATAELLTHSGIGLVRKHYAGMTTRAKAADFFGITPKSVKFSSPSSSSHEDVNWPTDTELAAKLKIMPAETLAKILGCSGVAITKRCRLRGIPKPGRGDWQKARFRTGEPTDTPLKRS